jgi:hypothetical protein
MSALLRGCRVVPISVQELAQGGTYDCQMKYGQLSTIIIAWQHSANTLAEVSN